MSVLCIFHGYAVCKSSQNIHTPYLKVSSNQRGMIFAATVPFIFPVRGEKERASGSGPSAHHRGSGGTRRQPWRRGGGGRWGHVCVSVIGAEPSCEPQGLRWEVSTGPTQPEDHRTELQEVSEEDPGNYSHHFRSFQPQPQVSLIAIDLSVCLCGPVSLGLCVLCLFLSFFSTVDVVQTRAKSKVRNNICVTFHCLFNQTGRFETEVRASLSSSVMWPVGKDRVIMGDLNQNGQKGCWPPPTYPSPTLFDQEREGDREMNKLEYALLKMQRFYQCPNTHL